MPCEAHHMTLVYDARAKLRLTRLSRGLVPNITDRLSIVWHTLGNPRTPGDGCLNSLGIAQENGHESRSRNPF
jgi:hypothetical protein